MTSTQHANAEEVIARALLPLPRLTRLHLGEDVTNAAALTSALRALTGLRSLHTWLTLKLQDIDGGADLTWARAAASHLSSLSLCRIPYPSAADEDPWGPDYDVGNSRDYETYVSLAYDNERDWDHTSLPTHGFFAPCMFPPVFVATLPALQHLQPCGSFLE